MLYGNVEVTYQSVLKSLDVQTQLYVWSWILGKEASLTEKITNPFRNDKRPGCWLREYQGRILFTDYAFPSFNKFNVLHAINFFRNKGLHDAASVVATNLHYSTRPIISHCVVKTGDTIKPKNGHTEIYFVPHSDKNGKFCYVEHDMKYWQPVGVSAEDLREANIFSIKHFFINGSYMRPQKFPAYAYVLPSGKIKIYVPYASKDFKWFGSQRKEDIWKFGNSKKLLITKSLKDCLVLKKILTDWEIWSFASEGVIPDIEIEHEELFFLYDNDLAGHKASERLVKQFGGKALFFNEKIGKDSFEIGTKSMDLLKEELKRLEFKL